MHHPITGFISSYLQINRYYHLYSTRIINLHQLLCRALYSDFAFNNLRYFFDCILLLHLVTELQHQHFSSTTLCIVGFVCILLTVCLCVRPFLSYFYLCRYILLKYINLLVYYICTLCGYNTQHTHTHTLLFV